MGEGGIMLPRTPKKNESCVCPVCNKDFKASDDTKYIARGGYTCSWQCFLDPIKHPEKYESIPQNTQKIVDNSSKIEYNTHSNQKVDLFSLTVDEQVNKKTSKKNL